jgi:hypothetical protein
MDGGNPGDSDRAAQVEDCAKNGVTETRQGFRARGDGLRCG